jgi:hypothetical protein
MVLRCGWFGMLCVGELHEKLQGWWGRDISWMCVSLQRPITQFVALKRVAFNRHSRLLHCVRSWMSDFLNLFKIKLFSLFMLLGWNPISLASLMTHSMSYCLGKRSLVSWSWLWWFPVGAVLCTANFSGCLWGRNAGGVLSLWPQVTDGLPSTDLNRFTRGTLLAWSLQLWGSRNYSSWVVGQHI